MIEWNDWVRRYFLTKEEAEKFADGWDSGPMMNTVKLVRARKLAEGFEVVGEPTYLTEFGKSKDARPYYFQVRATVMLREKP